jgi:hypothetical protein
VAWSSTNITQKRREAPLQLCLIAQELFNPIIRFHDTKLPAEIALVPGSLFRALKRPGPHHHGLPMRVRLAFSACAT